MCDHYNIYEKVSIEASKIIGKALKAKIDIRLCTSTDVCPKYFVSTIVSMSYKYVLGYE